MDFNPQATTSQKSRRNVLQGVFLRSFPSRLSPPTFSDTGDDVTQLHPHTHERNNPSPTHTYLLTQEEEEETKQRKNWAPSFFPHHLIINTHFYLINESSGLFLLWGGFLVVPAFYGRYLLLSEDISKSSTRKCSFLFQYCLLFV